MYLLSHGSIDEGGLHILSSFYHLFPRHGPVSMDAPVKKVRNPNTHKTGDKPGAGEKVTPEQVCCLVSHKYLMSQYSFLSSNNIMLC